MKSSHFSPLALTLVFAAIALMLPATPTEASGTLQANLTCEPLGNGAHYCEAFPQETGFSYSWSKSGPLSTTISGAVNLVVCTSQFSNGSVRVTITDPGGQQSSATRQIDCTPPTWVIF